MLSKDELQQRELRVMSTIIEPTPRQSGDEAQTEGLDLGEVSLSSREVREGGLPLPPGQVMMQCA